MPLRGREDLLLFEEEISGQSLAAQILFSKNFSKNLSDGQLAKLRAAGNVKGVARDGGPEKQHHSRAVNSGSHAIVNAEGKREEENHGRMPDFSLWADLGLPEPRSQSGDQGPPVDWALLRRLVRRELPEQAARMTFGLIHAYDEWNAAHAKLLVEEFKTRQDGESFPDGDR